jgi:hypothetical protein
MKAREIVTQRGSRPPEPQLQAADLRDASVDALHRADHRDIADGPECLTAGTPALDHQREFKKALRQDARRVVGKRQVFSTAH